MRPLLDRISRPSSVAPDPTGVHSDIYIAEIAESDEDGRVASRPNNKGANTAPIAAAPELLEAAQFVIGRWSQGDLAEAVRFLDSAVNPAPGVFN